MLGGAIFGVVAVAICSVSGDVAADALGVSVVSTTRDDSSGWASKVWSFKMSDVPPTNDPCSLARGVMTLASSRSSFWCVLDSRALSEEEC